MNIAWWWPWALFVCLVANPLLVHATKTPANKGSDTDVYSESLYLRPLPDGKLSSTFAFDFTTNTSKSHRSYDAASTELYTSSRFPRNLGALIRSLPIYEFHLTLTSGRWDHERWGFPLPHGSATGTELYAWLDNEEQTSNEVADSSKPWSSLVNSLAGMFCASLSRFTATETTSPELTYQPQSPLVNSTSNNSKLHHIFLPGERPCTENLTPLTNLLPCHTWAGLGQLLNPHEMFDANFQKLGVHVVTKEHGIIQLRLEVQTVFDPIRTHLRNHGSGSRDWSLTSLFGKSINQTCPASQSTQVIVDVSGSQNNNKFDDNFDDIEDTFVLDAGDNIKPKRIQALPAHLSPFGIKHDTKRYLYNLDKLNQPFELAQSWKTLAEESFEYPTEFDYTAPIDIKRILTGYGQEKGTIGIKIYNSINRPINVDWLESWPWWLKPYLHSMTINVDGVDQPQNTSSEYFTLLDYVPAQDRVRPCTLQARLNLEPNSVTSLVLPFDKASLRYSEHPPDANRGLTVPPAVIFLDTQQIVPILSPSSSSFLSSLLSKRPEIDDDAYWLRMNNTRLRLYTTSSLVRMPTPDFSMPYNVIILTCTCIALFFGSMFNLFTRTFVLIKSASSSD